MPLEMSDHADTQVLFYGENGFIFIMEGYKPLALISVTGAVLFVVIFEHSSPINFGKIFICHLPKPRSF